MAIKNSGNVVQIHEHSAFSRRFSPISAARLLSDCKDSTLEHIAQTVARAMDNVDDALFALADKADTNVLQGHYFDAMREIRLKRHEIEDSFKKLFSATADRLIANTSNQSTQGGNLSIADVGLSLIENDDLEEALAINTLVDKLNALCRSELFALDQRIGFLLDKMELRSEDNPVGPKTICTAFKAACNNIESGVDIKIIVFKLFDRYVCEGIQALYDEINHYLATNGVLSKIATQIKNGQQTQMGGGFYAGANMDNTATVSEPDFLTAFAQLMSTNQPQLTGGTGFYQASGMMPTMMPAAMAPAILNDLTLLQKGQWDALGAQGVSVDPALLNLGTTNVVRIIKDNPISSGLDNGNDMIIEVVALLFDYIFDNENIPDRAKALIGRLQIPVLKVAIMDKSFFSKRHHPARQLLNLLAHATVGLSGEAAEENALYKQLDAIIQKVQVEFDTDIAVFETAINDLEAFLEHHQAHLDENLEEAKKVIQGRERLKIAESMAEDEIERKLEGKPFPEFIKTFALDKWKNLLIVTYLKEGQDSEAWKSRLEILDLLIWSTLPKSGLREKKKLVDMLPTLLSGIESGMRFLSMEEAEQSEFLEKLASCHARAVNSETTSSIQSAAKSMNIDLDIGSFTKQDASTVKTATDAIPGVDSLDSLFVEEINLLGTQNALGGERETEEPTERLMVKIDPFAEGPAVDQNLFTNAEREQTAVEDEYTELVRNLAPGIWLEFPQESGAKSMERLSWISAVLATYLFTNHEGVKTREISANELEEGLRSGAIVVADDMSFLVDRSFSSLLDELQKKISGQA